MSSVALEVARRPAGIRPIIFGKMPGHGDFVHRGLAEAALAAWDEWATASMVHARERLGTRFDELHESSPPWCFISGPGQLGSDWRIGVLAPSTDNVGRRFVLVLAVEDLPFVELIFSTASILDALLGVLYRVFSQALDGDTAQTLIQESLPGDGGGALVALEGLIAANGRGAWWPHVPDVRSEDILFGAEPSHDLIYRALVLSSGDDAP